MILENLKTWKKLKKLRKFNSLRKLEKNLGWFEFFLKKF